MGGKPMIQWVIENVTPNQPHRFIFICLAEHLERFPDVVTTLERLCPGCRVITVGSVTEGAACTVLLAKEWIDNEDPLMIANADQFVALDINDYLARMESEGADGLIMTFWADHPKWSYCRKNEDGTVSEVVEKQVISNDATVGIYNYRRGRDFVAAAEQMIAENLRVNNEFYVAPAYNKLIEKGRKIVVADTGFEYEGMFGLGTPEDLMFFKTTQPYLAGSREPVLPQQQDGGRELTRLRTENYVAFFDGKNIAGVKAMLATDARLTDPEVDISGREGIVEYVSEIFGKFKTLKFEARTIVVEAARSVIEFDLMLDGVRLQGTDVIEWTPAGQIGALRAYWYERRFLK